MSSTEAASEQDTAARLDDALERLARAASFARPRYSAQVLQLAQRLLSAPRGPQLLYERAAALDEAGVFAGTDWAHPEILQPDISVHTLRGAGSSELLTLECLSELRLLAIAEGRHSHPSISSEHAQHYLSQVLALNLDILFEAGGEALRVSQGRLGEAVRRMLELLVERIGYDNIFDRLVGEIWRILGQRPIRVEKLKDMVTQISVSLANPTLQLSSSRGAERLISALFGPTQATLEDPGVAAYQDHLLAMDGQALQQEANGFARAMHDTGLVSAYQPVFLRHALAHAPELVPVTLGLSATGREAYLCYRDLVHALIEAALFPETAQAAYGLALMLERGVLFAPPMAPALWRQLGLRLCDNAQHTIRRAAGTARSPREYLLAGVLGVLGLPFGIGQGNNPTCQSARAISMWAYNDPDYLLQTLAWAARDDELIMHFEGQRLSSRELAANFPAQAPIDVDPVSAVLVPHLDRIYQAMGALCADRGDDPHRWINPELHGWWVGRGFYLAVDLADGRLKDYADFVRRFYAAYNPLYNGNQPLIYPQPAGLAVTDSAARFVGWHAITIQRVALDQGGDMRVYFFNPNNDSGQDLGKGVRVTTEGHGERFGESSLPIAQFSSRLYLFHVDPLEHAEPEQVPDSAVEQVEAMARESWAAER